MNKKQLDVKLGEEKEIYIKDVISSHFKIDNLIKLSHFHPLDFYGNNIYFEVKSRRNDHNKYPTTMIGFNKVQWIYDNNIENCYFVFVFNDGNYYYKFDRDDIFETTIGGRCDRGKAEYKPYLFIPVDRLTKF